MGDNMMLLDSVKHERIIADLPRLAMRAGVLEKYIKYTMVGGVSGEEEIEWVRKFQKNRAEYPGLVLEGGGSPDVRCQAIAGALIRNFVDARVMTLNYILDAEKDGGVPESSVLLIPNLFIKVPGSKFFKAQILLDILMDRKIHGKQTVGYVEDMKELHKAYGAGFADFLSSFKNIKTANKEFSL